VESGFQQVHVQHLATRGKTMKNASIFAVAKTFGGEVQGMKIDGQGEAVADLILYEEDVAEYGYVQADVVLANGIEVQLSLQDGKLSGHWENAVSGEMEEMSISGYETADVVRYIKEIIGRK
jgi:hypothetical protein